MGELPAALAVPSAMITPAALILARPPERARFALLVAPSLFLGTSIAIGIESATGRCPLRAPP